MAKNIGKITQVIGPVIDISFDLEGSELPRIYDALEIVREGKDNLVLECEQHIGENTVRAIAMDSTDGFRRGMDVIATGKPIMMPNGQIALGRLLNVTGDPVDGLEALPKNGYNIHNEPPLYKDLTTDTEMLFTGINPCDSSIWADTCTIGQFNVMNRLLSASNR